MGFLVPCPVLVGRFKTTSSVIMFERPPSSVAGKLPASQTVGLAMSCNGCQEIEKVKDDFGPSVRVYADRYECGERITSKLGICVRLARAYCAPELRNPGSLDRTLLANLEQFVSLPGNNSSRESAPAPFQHAA